MAGQLKRYFAIFEGKKTAPSFRMEIFYNVEILFLRLRAQCAGDQRDLRGVRMPRYCLTLDLKDDETAISEYKRYHVKIWPEIKESILRAGILDMEIYLLGTRLFMIMDTDDKFSMSAKAAADAADARVQEWETLMARFQQKLPQSAPGEKWMLMEKIFSLAAQ